MIPNVIILVLSAVYNTIFEIFPNPCKNSTPDVPARYGTVRIRSGRLF